MTRLLNKAQKKKKVKIAPKIERITEDTPVVEQKDDTDDEGNKNFQNFDHIFKNLTLTNKVMTEYPLVSVTISFDSSRAITVTKDDETHYCVKQYDMDSQELVFAEHFYGEYIKIKEIEQNDNGDLYHVVYMDNEYVHTCGFVFTQPITASNTPTRPSH